MRSSREDEPEREVMLGPRKDPQVQSAQLREKLVELDIDHERYRKENAAVAKLKQEYEKTVDDLRKKLSEFERVKAEELAKFEAYKKREGEKLQREERKLLERQAAAGRATPDKREGEENQELKQRLRSLQEELKRKERHWFSTISHLQQQVDSLRQENNSLRNEVKAEEMELSVRSTRKREAESCRRSANSVTVFVRMSEKCLSALKKNSADAKKSKDTADASPIDGEKLISPLDSRGSGCSSSSPPRCSNAEATRGSSREGRQPASGVGTKRTFKSRHLDKAPSREHPRSCSPICHYVDTQSTLTTYGKEVMHFPSWWIEKRFPDGRREFTFPDKTMKILFPYSSEASV